MKYIPVAQPYLTADESKLVAECVKSTWISSTGKYIQKFETGFAQAIHVSYAQSCCNGTTALHLALMSLNLGPGDEIIVPVLTFVASINAISYVGAKPVFVDADPNTWNLDTTKIEEKITPQTKAILVVHLYGYPADMEEILKIARKYNLFVIEDAAEAHFAKIGNQFVGTLGDVGAFSFFGNKIITTGEGGMVVTRQKKLSEKIQLLKNHGMSQKQKYYHPVIGYNYRLTNLQAAIGLAQLKKYKQILKKRDQINNWYRQFFAAESQIQLQPKHPNITPVCWLFSCQIKNADSKKRNDLIGYLKMHGIDSRPFFYPVTAFPMYKKKEEFPSAKRISSSGINLPTSVDLTRQNIVYITDMVKQFLKLHD